ARVNGVQLYIIRGKQHQLPAGVPILDVANPATNEKAIVLASLPEDISSLRSYFQENEFEAIYFKNEIAKPYYLDGYGSRDQFAKLYKTIYQFDEFDVRYKLKDLAAYLKIKDTLLVKMIQIFQELEFVTITDGVMR
ncbi:single-stranded-DNA-specific exonuclease C-terminal domain-containing protein, partial [Streptomyces clavuligerus]|uniref:single-stranded-DNA-specific exonuclease C-terminal domain-containing protein n=1 Tax=Streptomyces clavuligerus TaxID=1901 RepID=UPI0018D0F4F5